MESSSMTTFDFSYWSSDSSEEGSSNLSLSPAHLELHNRASPILANLFKATQSNPRNHEQMKGLQHEIQAINDRIRHLNSASQSDFNTELGVIDVDVFTFTWDEDLNYRQQLEAFCRAKNYPTGWARYPPVGNNEYRPYTEKYWEACDWAAPGALLWAIWRLQKAGSEDRLIDDLEVLLLEYEYRFNKVLSDRHQTKGNRGSKAFMLESENVLESYRVLAECLDTGHQEGAEAYERCRRDLRNLCVLHGYPLQWVPRAFEEERKDI